MFIKMKKTSKAQNYGQLNITRNDKYARPKTTNTNERNLKYNWRKSKFPAITYHHYSSTDPKQNIPQRIGYYVSQLGHRECVIEHARFDQQHMHNDRPVHLVQIEKHWGAKIRILPTNHLNQLSNLSTQTFSKVKALTTKCTLIYFPIFCSRKRQPIILKFNHCFWCLPAHILNCILITYNNTPSLLLKRKQKGKRLLERQLNTEL